MPKFQVARRSNAPIHDNRILSDLTFPTGTLAYCAEQFSALKLFLDGMAATDPEFRLERYEYKVSRSHCFRAFN